MNNNEHDLFQIVRRNEEELFFLLIEKIDINQKNEYGQSLLHEAVTAKSNVIGNELIKKNINVNSQDKNGQTALHYCAVHNNYELAKAILEKKGDLKIVDKYGNQALWTAVFNAKGNYSLVELMVEYKADINNKNLAGRSPLDFAKQIKDEKLINILEIK